MNNTREIIQKIWGIIKTDSLASSRIGTPTEITIEKLSALLEEARQEGREEMKKKCLKYFTNGQCGNMEELYHSISSL